MGSDKPVMVPAPRPWICWALILLLLSFWWVGFLTVVGWLWEVVG